MPSSIRIFRIRGIDIRIDPSWIVIFALLTWSLGATFLSLHPSWGLFVAFLVGAVAALSFFASVLVHELAHTLVATAWGIPVRDITLHLFGGMSSLEREPPTPKSEFWMAIVGPIASLGIGVMFFLGASLFVTIGGVPTELAPGVIVRELGPVSTVLFWLASANILVALFNLLPGFPLDGGRVLRSIVWGISGDLQKATRVATVAGQMLGWALVITGLFMAFGGTVPFFGTGLVPGLWMALIGWVLRTAAVQSYRGTVLETMLEGVRSGDLMRTAGSWVTAATSVETLVNEVLMHSEERAFPVFEGPTFVGIVSLTDVRGVTPDERPYTPVRNIMKGLPKLATTRVDEPVFEALRRMRRTDVGQLPVFSGERFVGMLFERDVARWIELHAGAEPPLAGRRPAPVPG
jgi:Zn-dependent protease